MAGVRADLVGAFADRCIGPKDPRSMVLSREDEAVAASCRHRLLLLDDGFWALAATIPHLTRSSLRRCLQRYGIRRWPKVVGDKPRACSVISESPNML